LETRLASRTGADRVPSMIWTYLIAAEACIAAHGCDV
jgi:hypothetical protein